jgi:hypothetical protein
VPNNVVYKVIHGSDEKETETQLNELAKNGWRVITMSINSQVGYWSVILEKSLS